MSVYTLHDVQQAATAIKEAQISLVATLKAVYPVGTVVLVNLGRAQVRVRITKHARAYWYEPGVLAGLNVKTGKLRQFHYGLISEVVEAGASESGIPGTSFAALNAKACAGDL